MINGELIFKFVDQEGIPLYLLNDIMREHNLAFNVLDFVKSAKQANWTMHKTFNVLIDSGQKEVRQSLMEVCAYVYM